jgi:hypothetical protein
MKDCSKISAGNWIALLGVLVVVLGLVNSIVDRKVDEINVKFDRVEKKIDNIDANFKEHLEYHIETKDCKVKDKEVSYAEVSEASKKTREEDTKRVR